jgi:hypothetical protein
MAGETNTLAGLIQMNDKNLDPETLSDILNEAPGLASMFAKGASHGTQHKYEKKITPPGVQYRDPNTGIVNAAGKRTPVSSDCKLIDASLRRDKAIADGYKEGAEAYMDEEIMDSTAQAFFTKEVQVFNGTTGTGTDPDSGVGGNASGHEGFADYLNELDNRMVTDAGGSTADTCSSAYLVRNGNRDFAVVFANDGNITASDTFPTFVTTDAGTGAGYDAYGSTIHAWSTIQQGTAYSVGRIANIDNANPLTDSLIGEMLSKFPAGKKPTHIYLNEKTLEQLRNSRIATTTTGTEVPVPTSAHGMTIVSVNSLFDNEDPVPQTAT